MEGAAPSGHLNIMPGLIFKRFTNKYLILINKCLALRVYVNTLVQLENDKR